MSIKGKGASIEDISNPETIEKALAIRALIQIEQTAQAFATSEAADKIKDNELFARMKLDMIRAHIDYIDFYVAKDMLANHKFNDSRIKLIMNDIIVIAGLHVLSKDCADVIGSGFFVPQAKRIIGLAKDKLIAKLRPQLIPLAETIFQAEVPSTIGNKYGDIYETQMDRARGSRLNALDKANGGVPPQWNDYIKPFLSGKYPQAKL